MNKFYSAATYLFWLFYDADTYKHRAVGFGRTVHSVIFIYNIQYCSLGCTVHCMILLLLL